MHPVGNFDLQVATPRGSKRCNVSVLAADDAQAASVYSSPHPSFLHFIPHLSTLIPSRPS